MGIFDKLRRDGDEDTGSTDSDGSDGSDGLTDSGEKLDRGGDESERLTDTDLSVTGEEYLIETIDEVREGGKVTKETAELTDTNGETDVVAGSYARELIEDGYLDDESPLWLGYNSDYHQFREAGLELSQTFRHIWISGVTGAGKTTQLINMQLQLAYAGYGFLYFDPKGKDSRELLAKLPEHRLDDVIYIDPMSTEYGKTVAMNFLEVPDHLDGDDEQRYKEVSRRIEVLKAIMAGDEFWGINMETIMEVVGRAMLLSPKKYTIIDLYFILLNQQRREDFAKEIDDPFLKDAMKEIAEMDDDEVRPTLKRVMSWVLDPLIRQLISHRESTVDFREVIDEDKIVIVRTAIDNNSIKRMVTLGIMRSLWSAVQNRAYETDGKPDPYFVYCDEFDDIASEQLDIPSMLARARSMRLSVTLACQHPSQLSEDVLKAVKNNAKHLTTFTCEDEDDAKILMERFDGYDATDLLNTDDYTVWTKLPLPGGRSSEPLTLKTFAPYPNLRPMDEVDSIIEQRLDETGVDRLTTREIQQQLIFADQQGILDELAESDPGEVSADDLVEQSLGQDEDLHSVVAKAIFDEAIHRGLTDGTSGDLDSWAIPVDQRLRERANRYANSEIETMAELNHVIDETAGELIEKISSEDGRLVRVTNTGRSQIFVSGSSTNAGVAKHRDLGEEAYLHFTKAGLEAEVVEQSGTRDVDGIARIQELLIEHYNESYLEARPRLAQRRYERLRDEHPIPTYLTDGADVTVEFESTTGSTKKGQTVRNLSKAYNEGQICVFVAREETARNVWEALTEPAFVRESANGRDVFYNLNKLYIDGEQPVIENASRVRWSVDRQSGTYRLEDESGQVRARFDGHDEIYTDGSKYDGVASDYDDEAIGRDGPHLTVNEPVIPEREFDGPLPTTEDFRVVIVPAGSADDNPEDTLQVIDEQGIRPITDAAQSPGWTHSDSDSSSDSTDVSEGSDSEESSEVETETESESETKAEETLSDLKL